MNEQNDWLAEAESSQAAQAIAPENATAQSESAHAEALDESTPLNPMQMRFIDEYRKCPKPAYRAYLRAGYQCTIEAATVNASRLLSNAKVKAELARRRAEDRRLAEMSQAQFKAEIMRRFMARPADYIDLETGELRTDLTSDDLAAISEVTIERETTLYGTTTTIKTKTESRAKYAELAMRLNGWDAEGGVLAGADTPRIIDDVEASR